MKAEKGDIVRVAGVEYEIQDIHYQEHHNQEYDLEFTSTDGELRNWKSYQDGGQLIKKKEDLEKHDIITRLELEENKLIRQIREHNEKIAELELQELTFETGAKIEYHRTKVMSLRYEIDGICRAMQVISEL